MCSCIRRARRACCSNWWRVVICNLQFVIGNLRFEKAQVDAKVLKLQITNYQLQMSQLLLAIDTSGKNGSLSLARLTPGQSDSAISVIEVVPLAGGAFSAQLVPQISAVLKKHGYSKSDLGAFAVASGPGSFTGLRVGLAAIKALAEALQKPIVAISLLEAVACSGSARGRVLAALDAGRGDVYVGDYELEPQGRHCLMHSERLLSREEFLDGARGKAVVTPDAVLAETV